MELLPQFIAHGRYVPAELLPHGRHAPVELLPQFIAHGRHVPAELLAHGRHFLTEFVASSRYLLAEFVTSAVQLLPRGQLAGIAHLGDKPTYYSQQYDYTDANDGD